MKFFCYIVMVDRPHNDDCTSTQKCANYII